MIDEYIRIQDLIDALSRLMTGQAMGGYTWMYTTDVYDAIASLPFADVAPVVHGRWLPIVSYNNTYKCSECGRLLVDITDGLKMVAKHYPYCHCGAKMDGENKDE
jgi:DNA-directed RNA polymerase subunit RPC12/RpoP